MKSVLCLLPMAAPAFAITWVAKTSLVQRTVQSPILGTETVHGCYSSLGDLVFNQTSTFNTYGSCANICQDINADVAATQGKDCYCGSTYPAAGTLVDDSECNTPCPGYAADACGGSDAYTVINTGLKVDVGNATGDSSSSKTPSATATGTSSATATDTASTTSMASGTATAASNGTVTLITAGTSATASAISTSGATVRFSLGGFALAVLGMGTAFLV